MPWIMSGASADAARGAEVNAVVSILLSLVAITVCGGTGALAAFALVSALGLQGVFSAIVAVLVAVIVSTLLWALGVAVLRLLRWLE